METITNDSSKSRYHSAALARGLEVLTAIAKSPTVATLADLNEVTGYPKSTLVRLLAVLEEGNYIHKTDERPAYRLSHALLPIAVAYVGTVSIAELLRPSLQQLANLTGWTANIGVLDGESVRHLCVEYPDRPIHYTASEGTRSEAYCSGLGKAILSHLPEKDLVRALPQEPYPRHTAKTITSFEAMMAEVEKIRARGYAIDDEEANEGLYCISVPIIGQQGVYAALSVSGAQGEINAELELEYVDALLSTREEILENYDLSSAIGLVGGGKATAGF